MLFTCFLYILTQKRITELLRQCIFEIPTRGLGYDWTFKFGSEIWDKIDYNTVIKMKNTAFADERKQMDDDDDKIEDEYDDDDDGPGHNVRLKASKIDTSLLVVNTDKEFVVAMSLQPGFY